MKILVTGAKGFVGKNLCQSLHNIKDGKDKTHPALSIEEIYAYDIDGTKEQLENYCKNADFVFNLAGVNRPQTQEEFMQGNFGFASLLLDTLKKYNNTCPVMLSSSIQATLIGRYAQGEYGKSKKAGEDLFFEYGNQTGAKVCVYRFPNLFGKWCRPNYNSAVATFCSNYANDLPVTVTDPAIELELLYVDDLVAEMINLLENKGHRCEYDGLAPVDDQNGKFYFVPTTHKVTLGYIIECLEKFKAQPKTLVVPEIEDNSFIKKLYSTYLSYLPKEKAIFDLIQKEKDEKKMRIMRILATHNRFRKNPYYMAMFSGLDLSQQEQILEFVGNTDRKIKHAQNKALRKRRVTNKGSNNTN